MYIEIEKFGKWLRRHSQHTTTHRHYTGDLRLFFAWVVEALITLMGLSSLKESVESAVFSDSVVQSLASPARNLSPRYYRKAGRTSALSQPAGGLKAAIGSRFAPAGRR